MTSQSCPDDDRLRAFAAGSLDGDVLEQIIGHVDQCDHCQSRFETLEEASKSPPSIAENLQRLRHHEGKESTETIAQLLLPRRSSGPITRSTIAPPDRIGPYAIVRKLAAGGMGTVYEGRHVNLGRSIAIKLIGDGRDFTRSVAEQVLREWRAHGRLTHPGIVAATDAGLVDGRPYLVTELVDGSDLARLIKTTGPLRLADASRIIHDVANAMSYAHGEGVAHLDIKPSNIMVDRDGQVVLLDLGTARVSDLANQGKNENATEPTSSNFGTLGYLAPERMDIRPSAGVPNAKSHIAADIYSLGCTFQFLLTGTPPFGVASSSVDSNADPGTTVTDLIRSHQKSPPPAIQFRPDGSASDDRRSVQDLVNQSLAKNPTDRPASMASVAAALGPLIGTARLNELIPETGLEVDAGVATTGHTVQLTDLVQSAQTRPNSKRWLAVAAMMAVVMAVVALTVRQRTPMPVGPSSSQQSIEYHTVPSNISNYISTWRFSPRTNAAFLTGSQKLLDRTAAKDPSVQSVGIKSTAPRHGPIDMCWSPRGDRLAILTYINELRIYQWDENRLRLESVTRAQHATDWFRHICWHPTDDLLMIASDNFLMSARPLPDGSLGIDMQPLDVGTIEDLNAIRVDDRGLIVITTRETIVGWDVDEKQYLHGLCGNGARSFASAGNDSRYVVRTNVGIEVWRASLTGVDSSKAVDSTRQWQFSRVRHRDVRHANGIIKLGLNRDGSQILIQRADLLMLRRTNSLDRIGAIKPTTSNGDTFCEFATSHSDRRSFLFFVDGSQMNRCQIDTRVKNETEIWDWKVTEIHGGRLWGAMASYHPIDDTIAVAYAGGTEIWNTQLETVDQVPSIASIEHVEPLPLHDLRVTFRTDGSSVAANSIGKFSGEPMPPADTSRLGFGRVTMSHVLPAIGLVIQTNNDTETLPQQRPIRDFGIRVNPVEDQLAVSVFLKGLYQDQVPNEIRVTNDEPSDRRFIAIHGNDARDPMQLLRYMPSIAERWYRVSTAPAVNRLALCDSKGNYQIWDFDERFDRPLFEGKLPDLGGTICIALQQDGAVLFATGDDSRGSHIAALEIESGQTRWKRTSETLRQTSKLVSLGDGRLLVTNWSKWLLLNTASGRTLNDISPRGRYGFRHAWSCVDHFDDSVSTWHSYGAVEPAAFWSRAMNLNYLLFGTDSNSWVTLSPDGVLLDSTQPNNRPVTRYVGKSTADFQPASWAETAIPRPIDPTASLSIIRYHEDDRVTIQAFK